MPQVIMSAGLASIGTYLKRILREYLISIPLLVSLMSLILFLAKMFLVLIVSESYHDNTICAFMATIISPKFTWEKAHNNVARHLKLRKTDINSKVGNVFSLSGGHFCLGNY